MADINRIELNDNDVLLGCKYFIKGGVLSLLDKDLFCDDTSYYYIKKSLSLKDFNKYVRSILLNADTDCMKKSNYSVECVYLPTLRCGNRLIALNTVEDKFIIEHYFKGGYMSLPSLNISTLAEGCINTKECKIRAVDLSVKEVDFLISHYGLSKEDNYKIIFIPFYVAKVMNDNNIFYITKLAYKDECLSKHNVLPVDSIVFRTSLFLLLLAFCYTYMGCIIDEYLMGYDYDIKSALQAMVDQHLQPQIYWVDDLELAEVLGGYVPFLGTLLGVLLHLIIVILLLIFYLGILPMLCIAVPFVLSLLLSYTIDTVRNKVKGFLKYKEYEARVLGR